MVAGRILVLEIGGQGQESGLSKEVMVPPKTFDGLVNHQDIEVELRYITSDKDTTIPPC
jgi:hypothetical protein